MKDLEAAKKILRMDISREDSVVHLSVEVHRKGSAESKPISTPLATFQSRWMGWSICQRFLMLA